MIGNFDDNRDAGNFMSTLGPKKEDRTAKSQQAFWAGTLKWTPDQEKKLIENIKAGKKEGDFEVIDSSR